jgi:hypothetical protein
MPLNEADTRAKLIDPANLGENTYVQTEFIRNNKSLEFFTADISL